MGADEERRRGARQIAEARYGFLWHLPIYLIVNSALVLIWYLGGTQVFPWPIFPIFFWGIGVFAHYMTAYRTTGGSWIDREAEKILKKEEQGAH